MALVWFIEDNAAYRRIVERVFRDHPGMQDTCAFDCCEDALHAIATGGRPEVILLDIELPGMNGIEGIGRFKRQLPDVSILILTVFEEDEKIFRAICAGASGYLLKSEPMPRILEAVEQAEQGGAPMNPRVARRVLEMFTSRARRKDYDLNDREREILQLMVNGLAKKQIAAHLDMNPHNVNYFIRGLYRKLHVNCLASAVSLAVQDGIVSPSTRSSARAEDR